MTTAYIITTLVYWVVALAAMIFRDATDDEPLDERTKNRLATISAAISTSFLVWGLTILF